MRCVGNAPLLWHTKPCCQVYVLMFWQIDLSANRLKEMIPGSYNMPVRFTCMYSSSFGAQRDRACFSSQWNQRVDRFTAHEYAVGRIVKAARSPVLSSIKFTCSFWGHTGFMWRSIPLIVLTLHVFPRISAVSIPLRWTLSLCH